MKSKKTKQVWFLQQRIQMQLCLGTKYQGFWNLTLIYVQIDDNQLLRRYGIKIEDNKI